MSEINFFHLSNSPKSPKWPLAYILLRETTLVTKNLEKTAYPERLRRRDAAALVADSCASLWASSSPRSRCRAQQAPWLWCCRTCCWKRAALLLQNVGYRCSLCKVYVTRDGEKSVPVQLLFSAALRPPCSVRSSPVCGPSVQVTSLWEWFIWAWLTFSRRREVQQRDRLPTQHVEVRRTNFLRNKHGYANFRSILTVFF